MPTGWLVKARDNGFDFQVSGSPAEVSDFLQYISFPLWVRCRNATDSKFLNNCLTDAHFQEYNGEILIIEKLHI
jgi:hypothetical protein